jgi:hypothetical protein
MLNCKRIAVAQAQADEFANQTDDKGLNTGSELREDQTVTDEDGALWRADPSFDGAFVDLHLGMDGLTMKPDNHFGGDEYSMLVTAWSACIEVLKFLLSLSFCWRTG